MSNDLAIKSGLQSLQLFASALSGRSMLVAYGNPGARSWTDGATIFIDPDLGDEDQLTALVVQASLLSAGSFAQDILQRIKRQSTLAERYLVIEGTRALLANATLLPASMIPSINLHLVAAKTESPQQSLGVALSGESIAQPRITFGVINTKRLLANGKGSAPNNLSKAHAHNPQQQPQALKELDDENDDDNDSSIAIDMFSIGGASGFMGRWLQRLLKSVRRGQGRESGTPGTDSPTHRSNSIVRSGGRSVVSTATVGAIEETMKTHGGITYPEWNLQQQRYRENWCTVKETQSSLKENVDTPTQETNSLRRPLSRIGLTLDNCRRQFQGDDIDLDAAIEARIEVLSGSMPAENIYVESRHRRRDLSVLILLDISGSANEPSSKGQSVHEQQREAALTITSTLDKLGDRVALYAYNSRGRSQVQLFPIKRFDTHLSTRSMQQLYSLKPGGYSRLGAAMRHGAAVLEAQGGTSRRLLLVISDGLAYDHGYEKEYGAADAQRALSEARHRGTASLCLTFGPNTDAESLRQVFGAAAHATFSDPSHLANAIGLLFRSALRAAEVRRQVA